jgi:hypothetical protein
MKRRCDYYGVTTIDDQRTKKMKARKHYGDDATSTHTLSRELFFCFSCVVTTATLSLHHVTYPSLLPFLSFVALARFRCTLRYSRGALHRKQRQAIPRSCTTAAPWTIGPVPDTNSTKAFAETHTSRGLRRRWMEGCAVVGSAWNSKEVLVFRSGISQIVVTVDLSKTQVAWHIGQSLRKSGQRGQRARNHLSRSRPCCGDRLDRSWPSPTLKRRWACVQGCEPRPSALLCQG